MPQYPKSIVEFAEGEGHMHRDTHVVLTSGAHSNAYGNYRFLGPEDDGSDPFLKAREHYVRALRDKVCFHLGKEPNELYWVGPETMGAEMVDTLACVSYVDKRQVVDTLKLEKDGPKAFKMPEHVDILNPERKPVVFMNDVLTGGTTLVKASPITKFLGGVNTVTVWMDRSELNVSTLKIENLVALDIIDASNWSQSDCAKHGPCEQRIPMRTDIGKPESFLAEYPEYPTG